MLLNAEEMATVQEKDFDYLKYIDPVLEHDRHNYHEFISDLHRYRLVRYITKPRVQVGIFIVTKKGDR